MRLLPKSTYFPVVKCYFFVNYLGDDSFLIGGIDFPLPLGTAGAGVRFPISGAVEQGTSPFAYAHGHAFNPSSAFDFTKSDGVRRKPIPSALFNSDIISSKTKKRFHPL